MNIVIKKVVGQSSLRLSLAFVVLSQISGINVASAASVSCEETPHTRFESAICADPALLALDHELSTALTRAIERNVVAPVQAAELRNGVAKLCWREPEPMLQACLLSAELGAFEWVTSRLAEATSSVATRGYVSPRLVDLSKGGWDIGRFERATREWRSGDPLTRKIKHLNNQLTVAESYLKQSGNTDLIVATIVGLLDTLQEQKIALHDNLGRHESILNLERRVALGCSNAKRETSWDSSLKQHNQSCAGHRQNLPMTATADY